MIVIALPLRFMKRHHDTARPQDELHVEQRAGHLRQEDVCPFPSPFGAESNREVLDFQRGDHVAGVVGIEPEIEAVQLATCLLREREVALTQV